MMSLTIEKRRKTIGMEAVAGAIVRWQSIGIVRRRVAGQSDGRRWKGRAGPYLMADDPLLKQIYIQN
jgi:hypothetical protein